MTVERDPVLDHALPIVDPHHHLWVRHGSRYLLDAFLADIRSGHRIVSTVYVECTHGYREDGPESMRPVGEAAFVADIAAKAESGASGATRICEGFIGTADFTLGAAVDAVLDALDHASGGRLRGIRVGANWDADPSVNTGTRPFGPPELLLGKRFREGFARLVRRGLPYDAFIYHPQLPDVIDLADSFPDATIVIDHCGGLLGIGPYADPGRDAYWRALVTEAAKRPNLRMKLGGLAARRCGFAYDAAMGADDLARLWRPYIRTCIDLFGPARCMFESNFPPDRAAGSYRTIWNAYKILASDLSPADKAWLFAGTARQTYNLKQDQV